MALAPTRHVIGLLNRLDPAARRRWHSNHVEPAEREMVPPDPVKS